MSLTRFMRAGDNMDLWRDRGIILMSSKSILAKALLSGALVVIAVSAARADIIFYAGYYDVAPTGTAPFTAALPSPWVGSPNTTFYGDTAYATGSDPDESGFMITNTGATSVTLSPGVTIGGLQLWDSLIGAGGTVIGPGTNLILSGTNGGNFDGSDIGLSDAVINLTIDGVAYSYTDSTSILFGSTICGSCDETIPWTEIGRISAATGAAPIPAALPLFAGGMGVMGLLAHRRKRKSAA